MLPVRRSSVSNWMEAIVLLRLLFFSVAKYKIVGRSACGATLSVDITICHPSASQASSEFVFDSIGRSAVAYVSVYLSSSSYTH